MTPAGEYVIKRTRNTKTVSSLRVKLAEAKKIYKSNLRIVTFERDSLRDSVSTSTRKGRKTQDSYKAKLELQNAVNDKRIAESENKKLRAKIKDLEKAMKSEKQEVERLEREGKKTRSQLFQQCSKGKEMVQMEREKTEKRLSGTIKRKFDSLTDYANIASRLDKSISVLENDARFGGENSLKFYPSLLKRLNKRLIHQTKFPTFHGFSICQEIGLSRRDVVTLKHRFQEQGMVDPFPSLKELRKYENIVAPKTIYEVKQFNIIDKHGVDRVVTYAYLNDVQNTLNARVQQLYDAEKLEFDNCTGDKIWMVVLGDKGGEEWKLFVSIGNVQNPNSSHHLLPIGFFNDDETAENMIKYLGQPIAQLNSINSITITTSHGNKSYEVAHFLAGDMKFLYSMLYHQGAASTYSCMFCYIQGKQCVDSYTHGKQIPLRTIQSYYEDGLKPEKQRKSLKENHHLVFPEAGIDNVIPATLHIMMGLTKQYGFDVLKRIGDEEDMKGIPKKTAKLGKSEKEKVKRMEGALEELINENKSMELIVKTIQNFVNRKVVSSDLDLDKECCADMCLFKEKEMEMSGFSGVQMMTCDGCRDLVHGVCAGVWSRKGWEEANSPSFVLRCFKCAKFDRSRVLSTANDTMKYLKTELDIEKEKLRLVTEELGDRYEVWKGRGATRKKLEMVWKKHGAICSSFKQSFTGNQTIRLLKEDAINKYTAVLPQTPRLDHLRGFLKAMGKFASLCVARELNDSEIESLQETIKNAWFHIQHSSPDQNVTPKLHTFLEHLVPYARRHGTLAKVSEQGVEASHNITNKLKSRFSCFVDKKEMYSMVFRHFLFRNHMHDFN